MRWVFYSLLILNIVYLVWGLAGVSGTDSRQTVKAAPSSAPQSLKLLSEVDAQVSGSQRPVGKLNRLCPVIGPWSERSRALNAISELESTGYSGTVRPVQVEKERLNWVYLPAYPDREEALKVLRELQSRGVDSFIVGEGDDENAISLGYFSSEESAEGLRVKMNNEGYPAEVRRTAREVTEYWVYLESGSISDEGVVLRRYLANHPDIGADHAACAASAARPSEKAVPPEQADVPDGSEGKNVPVEQENPRD